MDAPTHPIPVAVVTGASQGLGKATAIKLAIEGFRVILTGRHEGDLRAAEQQFPQGSLTEVFPVDVTKRADFESLAQWLRTRWGRLDVLVNNAGAIFEKDPGLEAAPALLSLPLETILQTLNVNCWGALRAMQTLVPLIVESGGGNVVNVSSSMGSLTGMGLGWPAYRLSKTSLNWATKQFAQAFADQNLRVNSVCPGWVRTRMGGDQAERSVEQGIDTIVWLALQKDGPTGGFFQDRKEIPW